MKKLFVLVLVAAACSPSKKENQEQTETSMAASLNDAQKSEGWKLLFDGQTLNGWKIFKDRKNNTWEAKDGTLHCKPINEQVKGDGDERSDIMTTDEFENFEFAFDWKISPKGNSGVMFRVTEEFEQPYYSGPEYQVIDDGGYSPKPTDKQLTGANYDMHVAAEKNIKPVGEWNSSKIVVNGNHVEHWLNGQKTVEYELNSDDWKSRKGNSKWKDAKGYGMSKKGHIDLQDHGSEVWYKNIMIKTL
ncbi:MAG: DUF1080 domain-containing protein [Bacteroidetes bacterium]|nr:DUF1080 domain-containing protein [Bacteroidota bacterium]MBI3482654.1 DUF1080 domain-containing protein [Bacteroidota bacterium]